MTVLPAFGALALLAGLTPVHGAAPACPGSPCIPLSMSSTTGARVPISQMAPRVRDRFSNSTNWSGYAVAGPSVSNVTDVVGSWVVPAAGPSSCSPAYSAAWVGIDGDTDGTVEQLGTEQDWSTSGGPSYYAWWEMYPKGSYYIGQVVNGKFQPYNISPGDTITAEVHYQGNGSFMLRMSSSQGWSWSTTQQSKRAQRLSAEWIMEAPWSGGVLPLANFGSVGFNNCSATATTARKSSQMTLGNWVSLGSNYYDQINMADSSGTIQALTNSVSSANFSINWQSCQ
jgi:hypothetical protein